MENLDSELATYIKIALGFRYRAATIQAVLL